MKPKTRQMQIIELKRGDTIENILENLLQKNSVRVTANELGVSHQTIHNWIDWLEIDRKEKIAS